MQQGVRLVQTAVQSVYFTRQGEATEAEGRHQLQRDNAGPHTDITASCVTQTELPTIDFERKSHSDILAYETAQSGRWK